jgi:hypothetical protein
MYQQLWRYKVEEKLYLGGTPTKKVKYHWSNVQASMPRSTSVVISTRFPIQAHIIAGLSNATFDPVDLQY